MSFLDFCAKKVIQVVYTADKKHLVVRSGGSHDFG